METINVGLGARSYRILVASGLLDSMNNHIPAGPRALVTNSQIYDLYGKRAEKAIDDHSLIIVPDGEEAKQWNELEELIGKLLEAGLDRKSTIIAMGGGSVGDLAGFAASIYMRGIRVVHVPTTLLAMVDSSIGGKTAVNHPKGKNLVGSFHQPDTVIIDPVFLETLPEREIRSGLAEIIKYGVIRNRELFEKLEKKSIESLSVDDMVEIIAKCASIKAHYVKQDEEDRLGIRAALNYGHTVGHTVETLTDHSVNHGEGVAIGMKAAGWIANHSGLLEESDYNRINALIESYGLPTRMPDLELSIMLEVMHKDKKAETGNIKFILPTGIGDKPVLKKIKEDTIKKALEALK